MCKVTVFAAPTTSAQEVLSQLKTLRTIDVSASWAPDILASRAKVEKMLNSYLALPQSDKASISSDDTASINAYLDGFCKATKTDKAEYIKKHGSAGTSLPSSSSQSSSSSKPASSSSSQSSSSSKPASSSSSQSEDSSTKSTESTVSRDEEITSRGEEQAGTSSAESWSPAITLDPNFQAASEADGKTSFSDSHKSLLYMPVERIVKIMASSLVVILLCFIILITIYYIKRNRDFKRQNKKMLESALVYSHVYRIKSVRRGKALKTPEYAAVLGAEPKSFASSLTQAEPKGFTERSAPHPQPKLAAELDLAVKKDITVTSVHKDAAKKGAANIEQKSKKSKKKYKKRLKSSRNS
ncbi:MAG: hypothetical protein RR622_08620 [Hydrogenoanaerobacterium sp.]